MINQSATAKATATAALLLLGSPYVRIPGRQVRQVSPVLRCNSRAVCSAPHRKRVIEVEQKAHSEVGGLIGAQRAEDQGAHYVVLRAGKGQVSAERDEVRRKAGRQLLNVVAFPGCGRRP